jgi:8-oxo-dGTP diphosphatase
MSDETSSSYPVSPRVAVGCVVIHEGRVLLVQRGRAPSRGLWAVPGGSVRLGERLDEAAEREVLEETGVRVEAGEIVHTFDVIDHDDAGRVRHHYVVVDVLGRYLSGQPRADDDAAAAGWFAAADLDGLELSEETRRLLTTKLAFGADPAARA